jgi:HEAT repeat protein
VVPLRALRELLEGFPANPALSVRSLRQLMECSPDLFLRASLMLSVEELPPASRPAWGALLSARPELADLLCDPRESDATQAVAVARMVAGVDPTFEVRLFKRLEDAPPAQRGPVAYRVLDLVGHISQSAKALPFALQLSADPDRWIRSKVALLIGRWRHDTRLLERCLGDSDPRVRANAVESLWGSRDPQVCERFHAALADYNHRVSANAVVGLHLAGSEPVKPMLETLISHGDNMFQAAGAWAVGRCREASLAYSLRRMAGGFGPQRRSALRALVELRSTGAVSEISAPAGR